MYALIVNPVSGNGRGMREYPRVEALLREEGVPYRLLLAEEHGSVRAYAAEAVRDRMDGIIAVGGDGTLFEIINGMAGSGLALLFFCCGTGNDFVKSLNLPKDPFEALRRQLHAPLTPIDIGRMNDIYFLNVSGTGLDTEVLVQAEKYKRDHTGLGVYLRGVRDAIRFFRPTRAQVGFDGAEPEDRRFSILSIGNGRYFGGGMKPVPTAILNDGLFDVVVTRPVKKWMIGFLLMLFVPGWYAKTFLAKTLRCRSVRIVAPGMTLNLDGELIRCDDARFELLPAALNVRVPGLSQ
ncbi:MAG: diacylglycerol kinase family lipid kinase [Clostridiales bacterium]|jgi:diacylglycerol kinase (ATP)|nr:diacylglycerol kinase family lipid kinase [Clostridiales bacterium]